MVNDSFAMTLTNPSYELVYSDCPSMPYVRVESNVKTDFIRTEVPLQLQFASAIELVRYLNLLSYTGIKYVRYAVG
jgi:hypothetical protein